MSDPREDQARLRIVRLMVTELAGFKCRCGLPKKDAQSFCRRCFYMLPAENRSALYRRVGAGYEVAYTRSVRYLAAVGRMEVPAWVDSIDPPLVADDPAHDADMKRRGYR